MNNTKIGIGGVNNTEKCHDNNGKTEDWQDAAGRSCVVNCRRVTHQQLWIGTAIRAY